MTKQIKMTKFHPFFAVGSVGMILTATLHIFLSLGLLLTSVHTTFFIMYPTFLTFLILGLALTIQKQKRSSVN